MSRLRGEQVKSDLLYRQTELDTNIMTTRVA